MQSWLTDLPAIQTGMLVVSAVTFHSTGSEVRPRPAAAAVNLCLKATVIYNGDLSKQEEVEALPLIAATGTLTLSWFATEKLCRFVFPDPGCALFSTVGWTNTEFFSVWRFAPTHQNPEVLELGNVSNLINAVLQTGLSGFPRHVVTVLAALYGYFTSLICPRKHGVHMNCWEW